jgi:hypothetical protein
MVRVAAAVNGVAKGAVGGVEGVIIAANQQKSRPLVGRLVFLLLCLAYFALTVACPTENWLSITRTTRARTIIRMNKPLKNMKFISEKPCYLYAILMQMSLAEVAKI